MAEFDETPGRVTLRRTLVPGQSLDMEIEPRAGQLRIAVLSLQAKPKISGKPTADPDSPFETPLKAKGLPARIRVRRPNGTASTFQIHEPVVDLDDPLPSVELDVPTSQQKRTWRIAITNTSNESAKVVVTAFFVAKRRLLHTTRIPISLLNGAARELIKGLGLRVRLDANRRSFIDFSADLKRHSGGALSRHQFDVTGLQDLNLRTINARVVTPVVEGRRRVFFNVFARFEERGQEIDFGPIEGEIRNLAVSTRFEISYHRNRLLYDPTVQLGLLIDGNVFLEGLKVTAAIVSRLPTLGFLDPDDLNQLLKDHFESVLRSVSGPVSEFLTDGIMQLAERGHTLAGFDTDGQDLLVTHYDSTREEERAHTPSSGNTPGGGLGGGGLGGGVKGGGLGGGIKGGGLGGGGLGGGIKAGSGGVLPGEIPTGPIFTPSQADIEGAAVLQDRIDHVVVLMMENRSYDHLFGHITLPRGLKGGLGRNPDGGYNGLTGQEFNMASSTGPAIAVDRLEDDDTRFGFSPGHSVESVAAQMNGGKMDGFVKDFVARFSLEEITKVNPMKFYGTGALPAYDFMIEHFTVCSAWFCSHPGATWPNRFCTVAGSTPEVHNLSTSDPRLGYLGLNTIFDKLDRDDWVNYESDVSFLRLFDRYRLDDDNIRPIGEFFERARSGRLPLFTFIDPDYTDVIPIDRVANDDHPPADMHNGQVLVEQIYNALRAAPTWDRTMFVITYDEHGGFYDHVPPPGTPANPDPDIPLVHRDGATFLGPRVPSLVVSPWAPAGPNEMRFEHTSIMKTVLLRKFGPTHPFMGLRVQHSNNLGLALTSSKLRKIPSLPALDPPPKEREPMRRPDQGPPPRGDDFHEAMRRYSIPT